MDKNEMKLEKIIMAGASCVRSLKLPAGASAAPRVLVEH